MATDIGESLVGSYLRYVVGCEVVVYNTQTPEEQGEIDVIGLRYGEPRTVWLCEVITHLRGTLYGGGYEGTVKKIKEKLARARAFADETFPGDMHHYEIWTPIAPSGMVSRFQQLAEGYVSEDLDVGFVANLDYTARLQDLLDHARGTRRRANPPTVSSSSELRSVLRGSQLVPGAQESLKAIQAAVWAVTDNISQSELAAIGYALTPSELRTVRAIMTAGHLDWRHYRLFQGR